MPTAVTLADFRPPTRADSAPWVTARIEESGDLDKWESLKAITLDPLDEDPREPALRSFTVGTSENWLRIVWVDDENNDSEPSAAAATSGYQFRPVVADVSAILRARTYTSTGVDSEDPMAVLAGGALVGEFTDATRPTAEQVEAMIPLSCVDVARSVGSVPGEYIGDARRVAALAIAAEIERSCFLEQANPEASIFQTLRLTYGEEATKLRRKLQWWALTEGLERRS